MFIQKAAGIYTKTHKMCTIYDGHSHVERRVYAKEGREYVRLNGYFFAVTDLMTDFHYTEVKVVFKSDDGRVFPTEEECLQHEERYKRWWGNNSAYHTTVYDEECNVRHAFYVDNNGEELQKLLHRTAEYYRGAPKGTGWFYLTCNHDGELQPISYLKELLEDALKNAQDGLQIIARLEGNE